MFETTTDRRIYSDMLGMYTRDILDKIHANILGLIFVYVDNIALF